MRSRARDAEPSASHYDVLEVSIDATPAEIRKAYRRLAVRYHPDKNPDGADMFRRIAEAYETLSDDERRAAYDRGSFSTFDPPRRRASAYESNGAFEYDSRAFRDPFDLFRQTFGDDGGGFFASSSSSFGGGGLFGAFGRDPFFGGGGGGGVFGRRRSIFDDDAFGDAEDFFRGGGGARASWSSSTTTTTTIDANGVRRTRTVKRRTLPDGSVVETETTGSGGGVEFVDDGGGRFLNHRARRAW